MLKFNISFFVFLSVALILLTSCSRDNSAYPDDLSIVWWSPNRSADISETMAGLPVYQHLQEVTGVRIKFIHPPSGQHKEWFATMLSSGSLPDIISHDFVNDYPGGVEKAIGDGLVIPLNDVIKSEAPHLNNYLENNADIAKILSTEEGYYFCFPSLQIESEIRTYMGPFYRADLFEDLGIKPPVTIGQWTETLQLLKDSDLVDVPLSFYGGKIRQTNAFIGAYGIGWGFYHNEGIVKYGSLEPQFVEFITLLSDWYKKGYIDPGFPVNSVKLYQRQVQRKTVGIYIDYVSSIDMYTESLKKEQPDCRLTPIPYPSLISGKPAEFGHYASIFVPFASAYITSANKHLKETARLLDYAYSDKGSTLFNFGIEGESFIFKNEKPVFMEDLKAKNGGFALALKKYITSGPYIKDPRQFDQSLMRPEQKNAIGLWGNTLASSHQLPPLYPSADFSSELNTIMKQIMPYEEKMVVNFITGEKPLEEIFSFIETLRKMGIERAIEIIQISLDKMRK